MRVRIALDAATRLGCVVAVAAAATRTLGGSTGGADIAALVQGDALRN